ncbi:MAG: HAMP domain-containing histidine kinase [Actinobacteria bacterium]|jgi:signal transduction histidine kinase|nr:HAMP domain-containing histidine kinase [Actinomycetota bacterium]
MDTDISQGASRADTFLLTAAVVTWSMVAVAAVSLLTRAEWRGEVLISVCLATVVLPALTVALLRLRRACRRADADLAELEAVAHRSARALQHDEDRLHELRETCAGVVLSEQLIRSAESRHDHATLERLRSLHDRELDRLQRLLRPAGLGPGRTTFSLREVVEECVGAARLRGVRVQHRWSGTDVQVPGQVREILHVLLENAAAHAPGSPVEVVVGRTGSVATVRVRDRGAGVPPELGDRIFERGTRGPTSSGTGTGLALARRLSEEIGGRLALGAPLPGGGGDFELRVDVRGEACRALEV